MSFVPACVELRDVRTSMMEQLYLARERSGIVHAAYTQHWRDGLDWNEVGSRAEEAVEQTFCETFNYFEEVFDVPITCIACAACVADAEVEIGARRKEPTP